MEAKKRIKDMWKMSDGELQKELVASQESLFKLRFKKVVEEITDIAVIRKTRRKIAQIKTILHLRELKKVEIPEAK
jgi:ribosomal protein L29